MTQDLQGHATPPNMPVTQFHRMCIRCGQRLARVRYSIKAQADICQPHCPTDD
jgi:hypothetical protein